MRNSVILKFTKENASLVIALISGCQKGSLAWNKKNKTGALVIRMNEEKLYRYTICETMKSFIDLEEVQNSSLNTLYKIAK